VKQHIKVTILAFLSIKNACFNNFGSPFVIQRRLNG
jgi:hypothetical protein